MRSTKFPYFPARRKEKKKCHSYFTFICTNFYLTNKKYPLQIIVNCISYIIHTSWYERDYDSLSLFLSYPFSHAYIFHLNCTRTPLSPSLSLSFCLDFLFLNPRPIRNLRTFFHPCLPSTRVHTHTHTHRDTHGKHTNFSPSHAFRVCICMYVYVFMYVSLFVACFSCVTLIT